MGRAVIVCYTPKQGKEQALLAAVRKHMQILREQELVTERPAYIMRARSGAIVEVFEWRSAQAIERAHSNPAVLRLWDEFNAACEYTPLVQLSEAQQMFAEFDTVEA
jgi:quinol monooxygenase YgiN